MQRQVFMVVMIKQHTQNVFEMTPNYHNSYLEFTENDPKVFNNNILIFSNKQLISSWSGV